MGEYATVNGIIALVLFAPGVLGVVAYNMRIAANHGVSLESLFVDGFVISIVLGVLVVYGLSALNIDIEYALWGLGSVVGILSLYIVFRSIQNKKTFRNIWGYMGWGQLWLLIPFVILALNGGLVDYLADSWWHLSRAGKMAAAGSVFLENDHLSGIDIGRGWFDYPPGWHAILALMLTPAQVDPSLLWHWLAPWLGIVTILAYGRLSGEVLENSRFGVLAAVLFFIMFGAINSYFRNFPWPGNVSYIFWYCALATCLGLTRRCGVFDCSQNKGPGLWRHWLNWMRCVLKRERGAFLYMGMMIGLMATVHLAEIFWLVVAMCAYGAMVSIVNRGSFTALWERDCRLLFNLTCLTGGGLIYYLVAYAGRMDIAVALIGIVFVFVVYGVRQKLPYDGACLKYIAGLLGIGWLVWAVDIGHVYELFVPTDYRYTMYRFHVPKETGVFGIDELRLPYWEHQLRAGLVPGGVIAVVLTAFNLGMNRSRATVFLFANAWLAFLVLVSPILFTSFASLIPPTSVYRIQLLIFAPIIFANFVQLILNRYAWRFSPVARIR